MRYRTLTGVGTVLAGGVLPFIGAAQGQTLPTGGSVVAGSATISQPNGSSLVIDQSSSKAILNWDSFSIGSGNSVLFNNGAGATLNRVTGNVPSHLDGTLSATGSVYLINPAGVVVGSGGQVATGGSFVASTLDVGDGAFLAGRDLVFSGASQAAVVNAGRIGASGGNVLLIARSVDNSGHIEAANGTAGLAAGHEVLVSDGSVGGGRLSVRVGGADTSAGTSGTIRAAVAEIRANGGNVYALAGNTGGTVAATGVTTQDGRIYLTAGSGGSTTVSGQLSARNADGGGGQIVVTGETVSVQAGAAIAADGTKGGVVLVGGDYQGGADATAKRVAEQVDNAQTTNVAAGARLSADGSDGNGGSVVVWANGTTRFAGALSATGAGTGHGGDAEVSGKRVLDFAGTVDLRSRTGRTGTLLLDPYNLTIANGGASNLTADADNSVLDVNILNGLLSTANVAVSTGTGGTQNGDITVNAPITWSADTLLTLSAAGNVIFNSSLAATGANAGLALNTGNGSGYSVRTASLTLSGANASLSINGDNYTLIHSMAQLDDIDNTGLGGKYALAQDLTSTGTYSSSLVGDSAFFTGIFAGLGHNISNLNINTGSNYTGLFGKTGAGSQIRDLGLINAQISGANYTGGIVGYAYGRLSNVSLTGSSVTGADTVGGLAGILYSTDATIDRSSFTGTVNGGGTSAGGLVGLIQRGSVSNSYASATVSGHVNTGGLAGDVTYGSISNSYALGSVTGQFTAGGLVGGMYQGTISNSYAANTVTAAVSEGGSILGSVRESTLNNVFWDKTKSAYGVGTYANTTLNNVTGLTTAQFQDTATFMAAATGWDFNSVWMPPSGGYYPELYALSKVAWVSAATTSWTYGDSTGNRTLSTVRGDGTVPQATVATAVDPTTAAGSGTQSLASSGTISNAAGTQYRVLYYGTDTVTVTPAALVISAISADKTYGDTNAAVGAQYSGLRNGDTVSGVTLDSAGLAATASVGNYALTASGATGAALSNYTISYVGGTLRVVPKALTVTATNAAKTYGDTASLAYATSGLVNGDTVSAVTLGSTGAGTAATVGSYAVTASAASGTGLSNYSITYVGGTLTVTPAALVISAISADKTYGDSNAAVGAQYSGLRNGDTVSGVTLGSAGLAATASVGDYALTASGATGAELSNYTISYVGGTLRVVPKALTVTATDAAKTYGDAASLAYTTSGLVNGDTVSAVTLGSTGAGAAATVGSYAVNASAASGTGLSNYTVSYVGGTLRVMPKALTVTAADAAKTYGQLATLTGYDVDGLINGDTLSGVTLASAGSANGAAAGNYAITASGALGTGLSNYAIHYVDGMLTVRPAPVVSATNRGGTAALRLYGVSESGGTVGLQDDILGGAGRPTPGGNTRPATGACVGGAASGAACVSRPHPENARYGSTLRFAGSNAP